MSSENGNVPPGQGRLAKAARAGLFPVPGPLILGVSFLAAYGVVAVWGAPAVARIQQLMKSGVDQALVSRDLPSDLLLSAVFEGIGIVWPFVVVPFAAALAVTLGWAFVFRKNKGRTAVALPPPPRTQGVVAIVRGVGLLLFCLLVLNTLRSNAVMIPRLIDGHLDAAAGLGVIFEQSLAAMGVVATLVGVIELVYVRTRVWRSLHLTLSEANREARATGGDREMRSERRRRARSEV